MERETTTLYKKVGRRYIKFDDFLEDKGLPQGLYLFYKPNHREESSAMMNMLHYAKVHDIKDIGKFSDLIVNHEEKLLNVIREAIKQPFSIDGLANKILAELSKL